MQWSGLLVTALLAWGCNFARQRECSRLAERVNGALVEIEREAEVAEQDPSAYERIAARYEALDRELEELVVEAPALAGPVTPYRQVLTEAALGARLARGSVGAPEKQKEGAKLLRKARAAEASSLRSIGKHCRGT